MSVAFLTSLLTANVTAGAAILLVMLARKPARAALGARAAYWLWAAPLLAGLAALLPARTVTLFLPPAPAPAPVSLGALTDVKLPPALLTATPRDGRR